MEREDRTKARTKLSSSITHLIREATQAEANKWKKRLLDAKDRLERLYEEKVRYEVGRMHSSMMAEMHHWQCEQQAEIRRLASRAQQSLEGYKQRIRDLERELRDRRETEERSLKLRQRETERLRKELRTQKDTRWKLQQSLKEARETNEEKARRWKLQCKHLRHRLAAAKNHLMQPSIVQIGGPQSLSGIPSPRFEMPPGHSLLPIPMSHLKRNMSHSNLSRIPTLSGKKMSPFEMGHQAPGMRMMKKAISTSRLAVPFTAVNFGDDWGQLKSSSRSRNSSSSSLRIKDDHRQPLSLPVSSRLPLRHVEPLLQPPSSQEELLEQLGHQHRLLVTGLGNLRQKLTSVAGCEGSAKPLAARRNYLNIIWKMEENISVIDNLLVKIKTLNSTLVEAKRTESIVSGGVESLRSRLAALERSEEELLRGIQAKEEELRGKQEEVEDLRRRVAALENRLRNEGRDMKEQNELMEFRVLELEAWYQQHQNGLAEARRDWLNFKLISSGEMGTSHGTRVEDEEEWEMWKEAMQHMDDLVRNLTANRQLVGELQKENVRLQEQLSLLESQKPGEEGVEGNGCIMKLAGCKRCDPVFPECQCGENRPAGDGSFQESGIFDGGSDVVSEAATQTEDMVDITDGQGTLAEEITKLLQFKDSMEQELVDAGLRKKSQSEGEEDSPGEVEILRRELQGMTRKVKAIEEARAELEEAENDARLRVQSLEWELSSAAHLEKLLREDLAHQQGSLRQVNEELRQLQEKHQIQCSRLEQEIRVLREGHSAVGRKDAECQTASGQELELEVDRGKNREESRSREDSILSGDPLERMEKLVNMGKRESAFTKENLPPSELSYYMEHIKALESERKNLRVAIEAERESGAQKHRELAEKCQEYETQIAGLLAATAQLDVEKAGFKAQLDQLHVEKRELDEKVRTLLDKNEQEGLRASLLSALGAGEHLQHLSVNDLLERVRDMADKLVSLREVKAELENKESAYKETLQEADKIVADVEKRYQDKIREMEAQEAKTSARLKNMQENEALLQKMLKSLNSGSGGGNGHLSQVTELLQKLIEVENGNMAMKEKILDLERVDRNKTMQLMEKEQTMRELKQEISEQEELFSRISHLQQENLELQADHSAVLPLRKQIHELREANGVLRGRVEDLEESERSLQQTVEQATNLLKAKEVRHQSQTGSLRDELTQVKGELQEARSSEERLRNEIHLLRVEISSLKEELSKNTENLNGIYSSHRVEVSRLRHQLNLVNSQLEQADSFHGSLQLEKENLSAMVEKQRGDIQALQAQYERGLLEFNLKVADKEEEIEALQRQLRELQGKTAAADLDALALKENTLSSMWNNVHALHAVVKVCGSCRGRAVTLTSHLRDDVSGICRIIMGDDLPVPDEIKLMPAMQEAQVAEENQVTPERDRAEVHRLERQLALSENEGNVIAEQLAKAETTLLEKTQALEASQGAVEHMRQRNFQLHCEVEKLRLRESELIQQIEQANMEKERALTCLAWKFQAPSPHSGLRHPSCEKKTKLAKRHTIDIPVDPVESEREGRLSSSFLDESPLRESLEENHANERSLNPPTDFCITRRVGTDGLLVAWQPPVDTLVAGYHLYVGGNFHHHVRSPHRTKALLNGLHLVPGLTVSIRTLDSEGRLSVPATTTLFSPAGPEGPSKTEGELSLGPGTKYVFSAAPIVTSESLC